MSGVLRLNDIAQLHIPVVDWQVNQPFSIGAKRPHPLAWTAGIVRNNTHVSTSFFVICLIVSVLCLAVGYEIAGQWIGAAIAILVGPAWLLARKYPDSQLPLVCLLVSVVLAVVGRLIGSPSLLMIFGSAIALAVWDLLLLDSALGNNSPAEQTRHYENVHLRSLALALGFGLIAILLARFLNFKIPFVLLILFIAFILFALDRVWGYVVQRYRRGGAASEAAEGKRDGTSRVRIQADMEHGCPAKAGPTKDGRELWVRLQSDNTAWIRTCLRMTARLAGAGRRCAMSE